MSRMLAFIGAHPSSLTEAVGRRLAKQFAELSVLHSDGWGTAWQFGESVAGRVSPGRWDAAAGAEAEIPSMARVLYVRFASRNSAINAENTQPFVRDGLAFQHNGALPAPEHVRASLYPEISMELRGSSDSELYFALVRQHLRGSTVASDVVLAARLAAAELRSLSAESCLNAFILTANALIVVQSSGTAPVPLAAFTARGFDRDSLPRDHDEHYNRLSWARSARTGTVVVATSGIDTGGWTALAEDTVSWFTSNESSSGTVPMR